MTGVGGMMMVLFATVMTGPDCVTGMGEPPTSMGCGPLQALRQAMEAAVQDLTGTSSFITVGELLPLPPSQLVNCFLVLHHCW